MQAKRGHDRSDAACGRSGDLRLKYGLAGLLALSAILLAAQPGGPSRLGLTQAVATPSSQEAAPNPHPVNAEQRKQLAEDSARLLHLATDLKAEVDKTNKDTLSLTVIRKAGEIEKFAHEVRARTKAAAGTN